MHRPLIVFAITTVGVSGLAAWQVDPAVCPLHLAHATSSPPQTPGSHGSHGELEARGARTMGFDQSYASHHFKLKADGGQIEIHVNRAGDRETRQQIVTHLETITAQFKKGDFSIPHATHAATPDGVAGLSRYRNEIAYTFEPTPVGGRVVMTTRKPEALVSIHQFLRYQIREHKTGDPMTVTEESTPGSKRVQGFQRGGGSV